jgi:hypothetical protein
VARRGGAAKCRGVARNGAKRPRGVAKWRGGAAKWRGGGAKWRKVAQSGAKWRKVARRCCKVLGSVWGSVSRRSPRVGANCTNLARPSLAPRPSLAKPCQKPPKPLRDDLPGAAGLPEPAPPLPDPCQTSPEPSKTPPRRPPRCGGTAGADAPRQNPPKPLRDDLPGAAGLPEPIRPADAF